MSLEDIRSECSDIAGLLQPYVDGEVQDDEQEKVAEHLHRCKGCRAAVSEQAWVRATLQSVDRERAPQALRARIFQGLDEVDREVEAEAAAEQASAPSFAARMWSRVRDMGRGGLIMVPAGAAAIGLFLFARQGVPDETQPTAHAALPVGGIGSALMTGTDPSRRATEAAEQPAPTATVQPTQAEPRTAARGEGKTDIDDELLRHVRSLEPTVGFDVQIPLDVRRPRGDTAQIQLVSASLDQVDPASDPSVQLRYEMRAQGRSTGHHLVDRQLRAAAFDGNGRVVTFGGGSYRLDRSATGQPVVYFELSGIVHAVMLEGTTGKPLPAWIGGNTIEGTPAEYGPLLRAAEHLRIASTRTGR